MLQFLRTAVTSFCLTFACIAGLASAASAQFTLEFGIGDFTTDPQFNTLSTFDFSIGIDEPLVAGGVYSDPALNVIDYDIKGVLNDPTPSGFRGFNLQRTIIGNEFYTQGSSLNFSVLGSADLSDGLQVSELADDGNGSIFTFNGREVNTGRYHPTLFELFSNNTGSIQNSNNTGGVNPSNDMVVDVDFGEEYIVDLAFSPALTLAAIPEPSSMLLLAAIGIAGVTSRRR
ncbi:PEP-CTERM sorting domain-containing protein [Mariniblastus sp.]|nr:PEP-CTERM sorting domain-containing protein [Mariniblastus sp.]